MLSTSEPVSVQKLRVRSALLFSDVHLSDNDPALTQALTDWLRQHVINSADKPQALIIAGDLFDVWVGDDWMDSIFPQSGPASILNLLAQIGAGGIQIGLIHGNRDFLLADHFCKRIHASLLSDPSLLEIEGGMTVALCHGDRLCTEDHAYQELRRMVRNPQWQKDFLARPLSERLAIAASLREKSESEVAGKSMQIMDVTVHEAASLTDHLCADVLLHGHTHRPGVSIMPNQKLRWVLPDWSATPKRGGGLWVDAQGIREVPL